MGDHVACVHFDRGRCALGRDPENWRDSDLRLPCLVIGGVSSRRFCKLRVLPAPPASPAPGPATELLELALANLCPTCREPITGTREIGGRIVAVDCHHVLRSA